MFTHFTFNTYKNKHSLLDPQFKKLLEDSFRNIAEQNGYKILSLSILADHVHMLIEHPFTLYSKIMQSMKGVSSRNFFLAFPSNRFVDRKLWGRSYYYKKIKEEELPVVINYIENQIKAGYDKRYI